MENPCKQVLASTKNQQKFAQKMKSLKKMKNEKKKKKGKKWSNFLQNCQKNGQK